MHSEPDGWEANRRTCGTRQ